MTIDRRSFLIGASLLPLVTACGASGSSSSSTAAPLKIGASLPLTGPAADVADPGYKGYQVWQSQINARGGLLGRKVEFVILDDGFDQNTVVSNYNRLISQDRVDLLIGTFSSFLNLPASTVADRNRMLYIEPSGGAADIFSRGHTRLFFSQPGTTDTAHRPFAGYVEGLKERPATAAYLHQDDPSTDVPVQNLRKTFEGLGIKTVYGQKYPPDTKNFDAIANAIRQADPALVVHGALELDGAAVVQAMQRVGFTPPILYQTRAPSSVNTYPKAIGATNTEAIFTAGSWHPAAKYPGNAEFVADYRKQFSQEPSEDAANSYTAVQVLQAGVQAVGKLDQDAIAAWLHANQVDTIVGPLKWDKRGVPDGSLLLMQWQGGKLEVVAPASAATVPSAIAAKPNWAT
ncbi:amino acid ABC transporter substrate-binding protein [Nonomuraea endophytica]|uniref:Branched-chain amino acid transport system substrate-binding protein n=1 Tax=Nonomuraea endophytica TaxID=714136 RepID=A0A7W8EML3_9ACTN|nr:amino acid ABC transporter substrate-binding protein [Nonomuraea endophytica]MBB5084806.1 branched-chain amino acid transport system substrate-binding protein [Nonomuraea endophytica]